MQNLLRDIRYGLRQLRKSPGFTLTAVLTLALGVGANTAVFTLVHEVMLKSLPVTDPSTLVRIGDNDNCCVWGGLQDEWGLFSYPHYIYLRDHVQGFQELAAMQSWSTVRFSLRPAGSTAPADSYMGEWVSGNWFSTLGVGPWVGRVLTTADDREGAPPVLVLSYRAWQQRFAGNPSIVGSSVSVNGQAFNVIGVAPPNFYGDRIASDPPEFWIPLSTELILRGDRTLLKEARSSWLYVIGRASPGTTRSAAEAQINVLMHQFLSTVPRLDNSERARIDKQRVRLGPGGSGIANMKEAFKSGLYLLIAASGLVLLIACANLANLMLARIAARRQQISIQLALGASRSRLIRGLLTESVLLALVGGAAGLLIAYVGARAMVLIVFRGATFVTINTAPSLPILGFTFAISVLTGILFGVIPAWMVSRNNPVEALRGAGRSTRDHSALPQKSLVVTQAALSLVLLAVAGLVTQSLRNLQNQNFLFQTENRYLAFFDPELAGYSADRLPALYDDLRQRLRQLPGVVSVACAMYVPQGQDNWSEGVYVQGHSNEEGKLPVASWERVSPEYFTTIGTPILRGRVITDQDTAATQHVAVVNEAFVKKIFPTEDPIGRRFGRSEADHAADYQIVGVVADSKYHDASRPVRPMFFVPFTQTEQYKELGNRSTEQRSLYAHQIVLHVAGNPANLETGVRTTLASINPNLTLLRFRTYDEQVARAFSEQRLLSDLTGVFSILALALAAVGLYGVTAYRVARRTSEIGIRMALGATPFKVVLLVLRSAFSQIVIGLLIGIPLSIGAGRLLGSKLYGVSSYDPKILIGAAVALAVAAFLASVAPARTAAAVEPMQALRTD